MGIIECFSDCFLTQESLNEYPVLKCNLIEKIRLWGIKWEQVFVRVIKTRIILVHLQNLIKTVFNRY